MTPAKKTDPDDTVAAAQDLLKAAKTRRENAKRAADQVFWTAVRDQIDARTLRQTDACDAIGYTREYVRRQLKALADGDFNPIE
ncbi:hypothetical protein [Streptomyces sp. MP131-18]|uniref:hypothetical protein n=1 Tax=Streptomyces sp. MP131-18 TaxID=1857892 RepID=UPI00097C3E75|nr:hypothetical protein [Streptomyces sp. MP131-18]ONK09275.1 hypothetical protein STBA_71300 [Streptomyces sp. MP131-18]